MGAENRGDIERIEAEAEGIAKSAVTLFPDLPKHEAILRMIAADDTPEGYAARNNLANEQMLEFTRQERVLLLMEEVAECEDPVRSSVLKRKLNLWKLREVDWTALIRQFNGAEPRWRQDHKLGA